MIHIVPDQLIYNPIVVSQLTQTYKKKRKHERHISNGKIILRRSLPFFPFVYRNIKPKGYQTSLNNIPNDG